MQAWIKLHTECVLADACTAELYKIPQARYDDEVEWNRAYVSLHDSVTTGPMIGVVLRFAQHVRPECFTLEHRAFIFRVATDGIHRNPANLIPHSMIRESAKLFETLVRIKPEPKLAAWAAAYCLDPPTDGDVETSVAVVMNRVHLKVSGRTVPNAVADVVSVVSRTQYGHWRRTYAELKAFADGFGTHFSHEERLLVFERLVYAASAAGDPNPWLISAAVLFPEKNPGDPKSSVSLRIAMRRVKAVVPLCDPWYVRRLREIE